jgi:hypothetical protein
MLNWFKWVTRHPPCRFERESTVVRLLSLFRLAELRNRKSARTILGVPSTKCMVLQSSAHTWEIFCGIWLFIPNSWPMNGWTYKGETWFHPARRHSAQAQVFLFSRPWIWQSGQFNGVEFILWSTAYSIYWWAKDSRGSTSACSIIYNHSNFHEAVVPGEISIGNSQTAMWFTFALTLAKTVHSVYLLQYIRA